MNQLVRQIQRKPVGSVFTPRDFVGLGSRASIDQTLSRMTKGGAIRRLGRGIYDKPRLSDRLGPLSPSPDDVAQAIARRDGHTVSISPSRAANMFGLTTQVPAKPVYLTSGTTRDVPAGRTTLRMRKASPRNLIGAGSNAGAAIQALRYVGRDGVNGDVIARLRAGLGPKDRVSLRKHVPELPVWMQPVAQAVAAPFRARSHG